MKLHLKNIGILRNAVIEAAGITVVAGESNTGKSTFGKALFAVFSALHAFPKRVSMLCSKPSICFFYENQQSRIVSGARKLRT